MIKPIRTVNSFKLPDGRVFEHRKLAEYEQALVEMRRLVRQHFQHLSAIADDDVFSIIEWNSADFAAAVGKVETARLRWLEFQGGLAEAAKPTPLEQEIADREALQAQLDANAALLNKEAA